MAGDCLVVFQGAEAYVSPSWYASKRERTHRVVPTWNYVAVHAWGAARVVEDAAWLRRQTDDLTAQQERGRAAPWSVADAPADFIAAQLQAVVGLEIPIARIEGKRKTSQSRSEADRAGVARGLRADGPAGEAMAALVEAATGTGRAGRA